MLCSGCSGGGVGLIPCHLVGVVWCGVCSAVRCGVYAVRSGVVCMQYGMVLCGVVCVLSCHVISYHVRYSMSCWVITSYLR